MAKAILIDVHNTLLDEELKPNKTLIKILNALNKTYDIVIFTARKISKDELIKQIDKTELKSYSCYCLDFEHQEDLSDTEIKLLLLETIKKNAKVAALIDNSKKVTKAFAKIGINSFQFRQSELADES
jgi:hydroxymethylpyrimidine pyrophosphatase-like HAD family hydrolase